MEPSGIDNADLLHQPGFIMLMIGAVLLCLFATVISLRNARLWLLRLLGVGTPGVVESIEIVTDPNGEVLRRPLVAYTTKTGSPVRSTPIVFRSRSSLDVGANVNVHYNANRPERMIVEGFDVRVREMVYAALSFAVAIALVIVYFAQL
jgi:Protein of unknown function (DUF3592)